MMTTTSARPSPIPEILLVLGTRPEAVKLAPLVAAMHARGRMRPVVVDTGQQPDMTPGILSAFGLTAELSLAVERGSGSLNELSTQLLSGLDTVLRQRRPAGVVVQGDTATTLAGALSAFWRRIPVAHVEAGLRSGDLAAPFPEEANRKLVAQVSSLHLAPTRSAAANLKRERAEAPVLVTGNTVIDAALELAGPRDCGDRTLRAFLEGMRSARGRLVVVTAHRRESWGEPLDEVLRAVDEIVRTHPDVWMVFSTHANPAVRVQVETALKSSPRTLLTPPLPYEDMITLLGRATLVLSDSGGIQEEAPAFGVPVLVLRDVTERGEAIESGCARLVGTSYTSVKEVAGLLLGDESARGAMARRINPFGDGRAAERCEQAIAWSLGLAATPPEEFVPILTDEKRVA